MRRVNYLFLAVFLFVSAARAEQIALVRIGDNISTEFTSKFSARLGTRAKLIEPDMAEAAFSAFRFENPKNLTTEQARAAAQAIGCDHFILLDGMTTRRTSSARPEYYEAYVAIYVVSSRTGRLIRWLMPSFEESTGTASERRLVDSAAANADLVLDAISRSNGSATTEKPRPNLEEMPFETLSNREFHSPAPFRRIKPEYTTNAFLHGVTATVEMTLDLDVDGEITRTEITRWAGYGLDESVETAVRAMSWRPAYRKDKPLAMRVLLRYNFKKAEKRD